MNNEGNVKNKQNHDTKSNNLNTKNSGIINEYFSTHPSSETRSTHLEKRLENVYIFEI